MSFWSLCLYTGNSCSASCIWFLAQVLHLRLPRPCPCSCLASMALQCADEAGDSPAPGQPPPPRSWLWRHEGCPRLHLLCDSTTKIAARRLIGSSDTQRRYSTFFAPVRTSMSIRKDERALIHASFELKLTPRHVQTCSNEVAEPSEKKSQQTHIVTLRCLQAPAKDQKNQAN